MRARRTSKPPPSTVMAESGGSAFPGSMKRPLRDWIRFFVEAKGSGTRRFPIRRMMSGLFGDELPAGGAERAPVRRDLEDAERDEEHDERRRPKRAERGSEPATAVVYGVKAAASTENSSGVGISERDQAVSPSGCFRSIIAYVEGSRALPVSGIPGSEARVPEIRGPVVPAD